MSPLAQRNLFIPIPNLRFQVIGVEKFFYFKYVCTVNSILSTIIKIPGNQDNFIELRHFLAFAKNAEFFMNPPIFAN